MIWYVIENDAWIPVSTVIPVKLLERGWGNGYVAVPPSHCIHKVDYDRLYYLLEDKPNQISIHGGLTYSNFGDGVHAPKDWWVFGFDTLHFADTIEKWPKEAVIEETMNLFWQLVELEWGEL